MSLQPKELSPNSAYLYQCTWCMCEIFGYGLLLFASTLQNPRLSRCCLLPGVESDTEKELVENRHMRSHSLRRLEVT